MSAWRSYHVRGMNHSVLLAADRGAFRRRAICAKLPTVNDRD